MPPDSRHSRISVELILTIEHTMEFIRKLLGLNPKNQNRLQWKIRLKRDAINTDKFLEQYLRKNSNCIDVGSHKGLFLKKFLKLAPHGYHLAFEPLPELAKMLSKKFPDVKIINCALSDTSGDSVFYSVPDLKGWSGLKKQPYPKDVEPIEIKVKLESLDNIIKNDKQIDFIKIDVEGAELEVLQGAKNAIKRCGPIIYFEHAKIHNVNYDTNSDKIFDFFTDECRYEIWDLELSQAFSKDSFREMYESSHLSNYNSESQTNCVAKPKP